MLSPKQKKVLNAIERFVHTKGYTPSYAEIAKAVGVKSRSGIHKHLHTLQEHGFVRLDGVRGIHVIRNSATLPEVQR